jgi:hypothetical protein
LREGVLVPKPEVLDGSQDQRLVLVEGTQRSVAAIAEDSSDLSAGVIVVHLDRWLASADGAEATLPVNDGGHLCSTDAISSSQVVMATSTVAQDRGSSLGVVTRLAIASPAVGTSFVAAKRL